MKKSIIIILCIFSLCACKDNVTVEEVEEIIDDNSAVLEEAYRVLRMEDYQRFECCAGQYYYILEFEKVDDKYLVFIALEEANEMRQLYEYEVVSATYDESTKIYELTLEDNDNIPLLHVDVSYIDDAFIKAENIFDENKIVEYSVVGVMEMNGAVDLDNSLWVCHNPDAGEGEDLLPSVQFDSAGMCTIKENYYSGMEFYYGGYHFDDKGYYVHIDSCSDNADTGFLDKDISFTKIDEKTIVIDTDLCMTRAGDEFVRQ